MQQQTQYRRKNTKKSVAYRLAAVSSLAALALAISIPSRTLAQPQERTRYSSLQQAMVEAKKNRPDRVPGEFLVEFKKNLSPAAQRGSLRKHGIQNADIRRRVARIRFEKEPTEQNLNALRADPSILRMQPNFIYYPMETVPNDPMLSEQWAIKNIGQTVLDAIYNAMNPGVAGLDLGSTQAWDVTEARNCDDVVVAVVDTGVNYLHEDLQANMWSPVGNCFDHNGASISCPAHGWDYIYDDNDPMDEDGHGSHVASIIGASGNNSVGLSGQCWSVQIMAVRVLGPGGGTTYDIRRGINFALENGADIINLSLGNDVEEDGLLRNALEDAYEDFDALVVTASGNGGADGLADDVDGGSDDGDGSANTKVYPCAYQSPGSLCVAALDQGYNLASFSNYGTTSVDMAAPGTNIKGGWHGSNSSLWESLLVGWAFTGEFDRDPTGGEGPYCIPDIPRYITIPPKYCHREAAEYEPSTLSRAEKSFNISGEAESVSVQFYAILDVAYGDYFRVYYDSDATPFDGELLFEDDTLNELRAFDFDLPDCVGSTTCSLGFELDTDATERSHEYGLAILGGTGLFRILETQIESDAYELLNGTSMAAPQISGIAAQIRSLNPEFTVDDVIEALQRNGVEFTDGPLFTRMGIAPDAEESLRHIPPTNGLTLSPN